MRVLVVYATTEGQTRKIARHCARWLTAHAHTAEVIAAGAAEPADPADFDAAILAGSVHLGHYQRELRAFATAAGSALNARPLLFLSVSLAAAGDDPHDWEGLRSIASDFLHDTGLQPSATVHVAGAFRFTEYDFFKSWAMRRIAAQKGVAVDPHEDLELTDWAALDATLADWALAAAG